MQVLNNCILANVDTDSFSVCKPDQSPWTKEEKEAFINYINSGFPELIKWCDDGIYSKFLVIKSKNYVMINEKGKRKIKGSALKDQKRPKALLQYTEEFVQLLLDEKQDELLGLYHKYVSEIINLKDVTPWSKKLTVTSKITKCKGHETRTLEENKLRGIRTNESKVWDAIKHTNFQEGNKIYVYFKNDKSYGLANEFTGDYDKKALLRSLYSVTQVFKNVIDFSKFTNYSLVKNYRELTGEAAPPKKQKKNPKLQE